MDEYIYVVFTIVNKGMGSFLDDFFDLIKTLYSH